MQLHVLFGAGATVTGALAVLAWRVRESRRPVSAASIIIPPLAMSTGLLMFALPGMRVPLSWALLAFACGALLFSLPLSRSSRLERNGQVITMQRSRAFIGVLISLAGLRLALRSYLDHIITPLQTGALFYLLAFGMIVVWRLRMLRAYRRLLR